MFFEDRGMTPDEFKKVFERHMRQEQSWWNFKLTNLPKHDVLYVYLVFAGEVQYRCILVNYERDTSKSFKDSRDQKIRHFTKCNWVLFTGPVVRPNPPIPMKGFQGFRYTDKLF